MKRLTPCKLLKSAVDFMLMYWLVILDAKRMIGRKFKDDTVQADMKQWSFDVVDDNTKPKIKVDYKGETKTFFPEEVSSILITIKSIV